jgi:hypothetical protein
MHDGSKAIAFSGKKAKVAEQRQAVATKVSKGMESYPKDKVGRLLLA